MTEMPPNLTAIKARADRANKWIRAASNGAESWVPLSVREHFAADVPALLARIAELEAEQDEYWRRFKSSQDANKNLAAGMVRAAERRGYERAVVQIEAQAAQFAASVSALVAECDAMCPVMEAVAPVVNWARGWHPGLALGKLVTAYDAWRAAQPDQTAPTKRATVIALTRAELLDRRERLLAKSGLEWGDLKDRAEHYLLSPEQREFYEGIDTVDYLLGDDQEPPTDRPAATESQDQGADDSAGTEGSQAQTGAQGLMCPVCDHDDHRCRKCGRSVEHGAITCDSPDCVETPEESADLVDHNLRRMGMSGLAPADPAGLDAAIEAATAAIFGLGGKYEAIAGLAVRAAAPHLVRGERAAALREAADAMWGDDPDQWERFAATWLRERAGRELES